MSPEGIAAAKKRAELAMVDAKRVLSKAIDPLTSDLMRSGATRSSNYIFRVFAACSDELSRRADVALAVARQVLDMEGYYPSEDNLQQIQNLINDAITNQSRDIDELWRTTRQTMQGPWEDLDGPRRHALAKAMADAEIDLLGRRMRRAPLADELSAPRYNLVRAQWERALESAAKSDPANLAKAVKEAADTVEAMAQLVLRKPGLSLGKAVQELRSHHRIPVGADKIMDGLYAFASSEPGARHGSSLPPEVDPKHWDFVRTTAEGALRLLIDIDS